MQAVARQVIEIVRVYLEECIHVLCLDLPPIAREVWPARSLGALGAHTTNASGAAHSPPEPLHPRDLLKVDTSMILAKIVEHD